MKKFILAAAMTTVMASPAFAENIGVSMALFDDNFLTVLRNGMQDYAATQGRRRACRSKTRRTTSPSSSARSRTSSRQGVDAIIVNPVDTDATPAMTKLAIDAGIPLVYVNRQPIDVDTLPREGCLRRLRTKWIPARWRRRKSAAC